MGQLRALLESTVLAFINWKKEGGFSALEVSLSHVFLPLVEMEVLETLL